MFWLCYRVEVICLQSTSQIYLLCYQMRLQTSQSLLCATRHPICHGTAPWQLDKKEEKWGVRNFVIKQGKGGGKVSNLWETGVPELISTTIQISQQFIYD